MGGYATGFQGFFSHPISSIQSVLKEAWTGNLSDIDKQTIINNANAEIAIAGAGLDPAIVKAQQDAALADINSALNSFSIAGDSGGAQPSSDLRLPGGFTVSPAVLEWGMLILAVVIIGGVVFPAVAPAIVSNMKAVKAVKHA